MSEQPQQKVSIVILGEGGEYLQRPHAPHGSLHTFFLLFWLPHIQAMSGSPIFVNKRDAKVHKTTFWRARKPRENVQYHVSVGNDTCHVRYP